MEILTLELMLGVRTEPQLCRFHHDDVPPNSLCVNLSEGACFEVDGGVQE